MTIGRPRQFNEDLALEKAMYVFWAEGYNKASLQSLLKATGLSKSSFYQTFGNKHALFVRCFSEYKCKMVDEMMDAFNQAGDAKSFIRNFLLSVIEESTLSVKKRKGCFIVNTANELSQKDPVIQEAVKESTGQIAAIFAQAINEGKKAGDIQSKEPTEKLVNYLMNNLCGLRIMIKTGADKTSLESVIDLIVTSIT